MGEARGDDVGRPTAPAPRAQRKRADVLAAAEELFLAYGYLGTDMDDLATRARVSKPTVYAHFGGKEALFVEIVSGMTGAASDSVLTPRTCASTRCGSSPSCCSRGCSGCAGS